jgi:hypothetical protein
MNRCAPFLAALALAALAPAQAAQSIVGPINLAPASFATDGQAIQRSFPQNALRGTLLFGAPPAIQLNGVTVSLASGYRIHGPNNLLVMSAQLTGMQFTVDYTSDAQGQVFEVWILSANEIANQPWPATTAQAAAWTFDPVAQTWTKP